MNLSELIDRCLSSHKHDFFDPSNFKDTTVSMFHSHMCVRGCELLHLVRGKELIEQMM